MSERPNILLMVADELPADDLGCYGSSGKASPFLDSLAAEGVMGEAFFTPATSTHAAVASLLTGEHPIRHGILSNQDTRDFPGEIPFLTELFLKDGYTTASFGNLRHERPWFGQGCEYAVNPGLGKRRQGGYISSREMSSWAKQWIRGHANESFVAWVHYAGDAYSSQTVPELDEGVRDLVSVLDDLRLTEKTLVVFTAAKGQAQGLSDRTLRVPMILRWPGKLGRGVRLEQMFQTQAIGHALLELGELPTPYNDDPNLWKLVTGGQQTTGLERAFSVDHEDGPRWALRTKQYKLALSQGAERELYDLAADPGEQRNIAAERPEVVAALAGELEAWISSHQEEQGNAADLWSDPQWKGAS